VKPASSKKSIKSHTHNATHPLLRDHRNLAASEIIHLKGKTRVNWYTGRHIRQPSAVVCQARADLTLLRAPFSLANTASCSTKAELQQIFTLLHD